VSLVLTCSGHNLCYSDQRISFVTGEDAALHKCRFYYSKPSLQSTDMDVYERIAREAVVFPYKIVEVAVDGAHEL
jgi:hypothetical protein